MRRNRHQQRQHRRARIDAPGICPCGALIDNAGELCRKCRRRLRWRQRMSGKRRDQWREFNRSNYYALQVVSPR